jgi:hypothetical protein
MPFSCAIFIRNAAAETWEYLSGFGNLRALSMLTLEAFIYINLIVAFAYVIKANTGFGENMIMIPLMLLFLHLKVILPLTRTIVLIADGYLWYHSRRQIDYNTKESPLCILSMKIKLILTHHYLQVGRMKKDS